MCACAAFRRIVSKSCSEIRILNCLSFFIFSPFLLKWVWASARFEAFGREPVDRRLAKCDAGSSRTGGFSPPRRGILCAGLPYCTCIFHVARTLAQRRLFMSRRARTRCRSGKPHTAATRGSRCGTGSLPTRRVDRADCFHGQKIGTIGTFKGNPPFAVAAVGIRQNPVSS